MKNNFTRCFLLALSCLLSFASVKADLPFRNHRYDGFKVIKVKSDNIVFLGNSITNMHEWTEAFANPKIINRGTSGAVSDEVIDNLESIIEGKPAKIFMMIGTNDLGTSGLNTVEHVSGNLEKILDLIKNESPSTQVYVQSILPSGLRDLNLQKATNEAIKAICEKREITYIDLWDKLMGVKNGAPLSLDQLHLTAAGYKIWCEAIKEYVGSETVYSAAGANLNQYGGMGDSYGMRVSYFGGLPVKADDVLIIGDEMIHGGEWAELLSCSKVKNRGNGWGYSGNSIADLKKYVSVILKGRTENVAPAKIFLYAGVADVNNAQNTLESVETAYKELIQLIKNDASTSKLYLMSLLPVSDANTNARVKSFNEKIKAIADADQSVTYVDQYSGMMNGETRVQDYFMGGDYVSGKGYAKITQAMAPHLTEEGAKAITDEEAIAQYDLLSARNRLGSAISIIDGIQVGEGVGQYTEANFAAAAEARKKAYELLASGATVEQLGAEVTKIEEAVNSILSSINGVKASTDAETHWYSICSSLRGNKYVMADRDNSLVRGAANTNYSNMHWKFVQREGTETYDIVNRKTGAYVDPNKAYNQQFVMTPTQPEKAWTLSYGNVPGHFIISCDKVQWNITNQATLVNWSTSESGQDRADLGCQFSLVEIEGEATPEPVDTYFDNERVATLDELTTGWYKMKVTSGSDATMQGYIENGTNYILNANSEYKQTNTQFYALKIAARNSDKPAEAFIHLEKKDGFYAIRSTNGHYIAENCISAINEPTAANQSPAIAEAGNNSFTVGKWAYYNPGANTEQPYIGKSSNSNNQFQFSHVSESDLSRYTIYTVSIAGAEAASEIGSNATLTCTAYSNVGIARVFNGGTFFINTSSTGKTLNATDFVASPVTGKVAEISIDEAAKTISVNYVEPSIQNSLKQATEVLNIQGVGYPVKNGTAYKKLWDAMDEAGAVNNPTAEDIAKLDAAIAEYKSSSDIQMPVDGCAYVFTNKHLGGVARILVYKNEEDGIGTAVRTANIPLSAVFVCHKLDDGKYIFVNDKGKYLIFKGSNASSGPNDNKGYVDAYNDNADFSIIRPTLANKQNIAAGITDADFFGTIALGAKRTNGTVSNLIVNANGIFNQAGTTIFYNADYSNVFNVEQVWYESTSVRLEKELNDNQRVGTLVLPFPTTIPDDVEVYTLTLTEGALEMNRLNGVLPAQTPVITVADNELQEHTFIPSTEAGEKVENNALVGSTVSSTAMPENAYELDVRNGKGGMFLTEKTVMTCNRAYLVAEDSETEGYYFDGTTTAIGNIIASQKAQGAMYDLTGRRITQPAAGSIYLQNGRKVLQGK